MWLPSRDISMPSYRGDAEGLHFRRTGGGSMLGDVNISAILDSFSVSYDKRVRPNYGDKHFVIREIAVPLRKMSWYRQLPKSAINKSFGPVNFNDIPSKLGGKSKTKAQNTVY
ncbi:hypothetical protein FOCC_FOCC000469 [Frankliniella occidentalis]|nr:hypothetical protein FOCC_FOCC000469 [Frankliniella occidentalis]